jgi:hypothetical protein
MKVDLRQKTEGFGNVCEKALAIALIAHSDTYDLDGNPVILHPMTVAAMGRNEEEVVCGLLHDVVEDTEYTFDDLKDAGIPDRCIETLRLLTHEDGVSYDEYLRRIKESSDEVAKQVKISDLTHNIERGTRGNHTKQVEKHTKAFEYMTEKN